MKNSNKTFPLILAATLAIPFSIHAASNQMLGWNNLGMHCMDSDYSVFSILPPYNTIEAQLIVAGKLVTNGAGYTVTYEAVTDPSGSFNATAMGKGNYYTYASALFGATLLPEGGLAGWAMPGISNIPQSMLFERTNQPAGGVFTRVNWFRAEGIPISPYDDAHNKNPYPLMRLIARNGANQPIATNDIVLPVSDEMDCRACHASGTQAAAKPAAGWLWDGLPERDFRLNILRLHDEQEFARHPALYQEALAARGFNPQGLYRGVVADGKPVLCAACHASEALGAPSYGSIPPLTASIHSHHAPVKDPILNTTLNNADNREACYRCHPGSSTKCLRGAMGGAIAADGSMEMQCQSCHGNLSTVGSPNRVGWFMEPTCQQCHSGTATSNNGQIRYNSVFTDTNGTVRVPVNKTFATTPNTPTAGLSLYRFSIGHGGLQCSACHGSTHAEFPGTHANDNVRNNAIQGHAGVVVECTACHVSMPVNSTTAAGGPHGMHPVGSSWVSGHEDYAEANLAQCQACHGADHRGTVLSVVQTTRTLDGQNVFRGAIVGCYMCHNGPDGEGDPGAAPTASNTATNTVAGQAVAITLPATGTGLSLRIISQAAHGAVGLTGSIATYFPEPGFIGTDTFTFAAYNGARNSSLATGTVVVAEGPFSIGATTQVPPTYPAGWPVAFAVVPVATNTLLRVTFNWNFGDGSVASTNQFPAHPYANPGSYNWSVVVSMAGATATRNGTIVIGNPVSLAMNYAGNTATFSWPNTIADTLLENNRPARFSIPMAVGHQRTNRKWRFTQCHLAGAGQSVLPRSPPMVMQAQPGHLNVCQFLDNRTAAGQEFNTMTKKSFTPNQAKAIGEQLGIQWDRFDVEQFRAGLRVELEHGTVNQLSNVTDDDSLMTGKIALAHLAEFPDYYTRLAKMEDEAKSHWKSKAIKKTLPGSKRSSGNQSRAAAAAKC